MDIIDKWFSVLQEGDCIKYKRKNPEPEIEEFTFIKKLPFDSNENPHNSLCLVLDKDKKEQKFCIACMPFMEIVETYRPEKQTKPVN